MEPKYTEVIKLIIRHNEHGSVPVVIDEKGDEYELTNYIDGDDVLPGNSVYTTVEAYKITS